MTPFLQTRNVVESDAVLARIRKLARRQSDAELMLDRGDFPLGHLREFDLAATPSLCDKAKALLRRRVARLYSGKPCAARLQRNIKIV